MFLIHWLLKTYFYEKQMLIFLDRREMKNNWIIMINFMYVMLYTPAKVEPRTYNPVYSFFDQHVALSFCNHTDMRTSVIQNKLYKTSPQKVFQLHKQIFVTTDYAAMNSWY